MVCSGSIVTHDAVGHQVVLQYTLPSQETASVVPAQRVLDTVHEQHRSLDPSAAASDEWEEQLYERLSGKCTGAAPDRRRVACSRLRLLDGCASLKPDLHAFCCSILTVDLTLPLPLAQLLGPPLVACLYLPAS